MNLSLTICPFLMLFKLTRQIGLLDWLFLSYAQKLSGCAKTFELALLPCYEYTMAIFGILSPFLTFENMLKLCIALGSSSSMCLFAILLSLCHPGPAKFILTPRAVPFARSRSLPYVLLCKILGSPLWDKTYRVMFTMALQWGQSRFVVLANPCEVGG